MNARDRACRLFRRRADFVVLPLPEAPPRTLPGEHFWEPLQRHLREQFWPGALPGSIAGSTPGSIRGSTSGSTSERPSQRMLSTLGGMARTSESHFPIRLLTTTCWQVVGKLPTTCYETKSVDAPLRHLHLAMFNTKIATIQNRMIDAMK